MIGYAWDVKKTIDAYDENGWFRSGDVGYYTDNGCLFIVGRIKEMIIYEDRRVRPPDHGPDRVSPRYWRNRNLSVFCFLFFFLYFFAFEHNLDITSRHRNGFARPPCRTRRGGDEQRLRFARRFVGGSSKNQIRTRHRTRTAFVVRQRWDSKSSFKIFSWYYSSRARLTLVF